MPRGKKSTPTTKTATSKPKGSKASKVTKDTKKTPSRRAHSQHASLGSMGSGSSSVHSPLSSRASTPSLTMSSPLFDSFSPSPASPYHFQSVSNSIVSPLANKTGCFQYPYQMQQRSVSLHDLDMSLTNTPVKQLDDPFEEEPLFNDNVKPLTFTPSKPRRAVSLVVQNGRATTVDEAPECDDDESESEEEAANESNDALQAFQRAIQRYRQNTTTSNDNNTVEQQQQQQQQQQQEYYTTSSFDSNSALCPPQTPTRDSSNTIASTPKRNVAISPLLFDTPSRVNADALAFEDTSFLGYNMISF